MKTLREWAKESLISEVPVDLSVWHWTRASAVPALRERLRGGGDLSDFSEGAIGRGLYVSTSAIDNFDKGDAVLHAVVPAGTKVLMLDADLFGFGVSEIFEMTLQRAGWPWRPRPFAGQVDAQAARSPKVVVPALLEELALPGCVYIFGFHLALMLKDGAALRFDPTEDAARTVAAYVSAHPQERPMLTPREQVYAWLQARIPDFKPPKPPAKAPRSR